MARGVAQPVIVLTVIQAVVTVALLTFSYFMRDKAPSLADTIVGFACAHWLNQSSITGRQVAEATRQALNGATDPSTTT